MQMSGPPTEMGYIHNALGQITATLNTIKAMNEEFASSTREHREKVDEILMDVEFRVRRLETAATANASAITNDVMPVVSKIKAWEQRGIGFLAFAGIAGTGLGAAAIKYGAEIVGFFGTFFKS